MLARFDDAIAGRRLALTDPVSIAVATDRDEVLGALAEVAQGAAGGLWAAGWVAYEAAPALDPVLTTRPPGPVPLVCFGLFRRVTELPPPSPEGYRLGAWGPSIPLTRYQDDLAAIRKHIRLGDTYQVNHTFRLRAPFEGSATGLYHDLCASQTVSYAAFLDAGRFQVVSASPELFYERKGSRITTRPMKGTAPRGRWVAEDRRLHHELISSEKQRAENLMIVDLLRNDLGRVAEFGSVEVEGMFEAERYETLWQLTSTISAQCRPEVGLTETFRALFPSGSVTGAPKRRTMEIIAERETTPRGLYTGALGYVAPEGPSRFSVAIRTVVIDRQEGIAEYGVGGGITWDSVPGEEYEESQLKARVLHERRRAFHLLETMRWEPVTGCAHLERHLTRLAESAEYFGYSFDEAPARRRLGRLGGHQPKRIRLLLDRQGGVTVEAEPLSALPEPARLAIDLDPVDPRDPFLFHKTTRREIYESRRRRHPEAEDVLLVNLRREVTESTIANLAVRIGEAWYTPPLESGCLPGVYRGLLLEQGVLEERPILIEDLESAQEVALISSLRGWRRAILAQPRETVGL